METQNLVQVGECWGMMEEGHVRLRVLLNLVQCLCDASFFMPFVHVPTL